MATLAEALTDAAVGLPAPVEPAVTGTGPIEFRRGGRVFAILEADGRAASFRLAEAVATAALRTPDTLPSDRGRGWVTLAPLDIDGHALDRATAWFESAWRAAAE